MFVRKSKYDELLNEYGDALLKAKAAKELVLDKHKEYNDLVKKWNDLLKDWNEVVNKINSKGGEEFLDHGIMPEEITVLDKEMINKMIRLCHPDKHGNSLVANEVTAFLLGMKE